MARVDGEPAGVGQGAMAGVETRASLLYEVDIDSLRSVVVGLISCWDNWKTAGLTDVGSSLTSWL